ncbi:MAG: hypothetical protein WCL51_01535 [Bacteroidota bacterium]
MKKKLIFAILLCIIFNYIKAQKKNDCKDVGIKYDTINYINRKVISEVTYCIDTKKLLFGQSFFDNKEECVCFEYYYNKNGRLKKIIYWTFHYNKSGYDTDNKYAIIKFKGKDKTNYHSKNIKFTIELAKRIAQINYKTYLLFPI